MTQRVLLFASIVSIANVATADSITISLAGIDSKITGLNGSYGANGATQKIGLGLAEFSRSGKHGYDTADFSAPNTVPEGVYTQSGGFVMAGVDQYVIEDHATEMAGVMIGNTNAGATYEGVAPGAHLHSIELTDQSDDRLTAVALDRLAELNVTPEITAINLSWGYEVGFLEENGRSHISQFIDWSARQHEVVYVVAWPDTRYDEFVKPADNYNGITVAASEMDEDATAYQMFASINQTPNLFGTERTYIDLLAPGHNVQVLGLTTDHIRAGTSHATAHVTGAIALVQQRVKQLSDANPPDYRWPLSLEHNTIRAVLMNAADRLMGVQGSNRDIRNHLGQKWDETIASVDPYVPIDSGMGAGHLNVARAVQQVEGGRFQPTGGTTQIRIPTIGYAETFIGGFETHEYVFDSITSADTWVSITLCWDREVQHSGGSTYQYGDEFFPYADPYDRQADLDLYLVGTTGNVVHASSTSFEQNVELIFFQTTGTDRYKIVVQWAGGLAASTDYGLAWWVDFGTSPRPGDFNSDGNVDAADYVTWRKTNGSSMQYDEWVENFGSSSGSGGEVAVPEPAAGAMVVVFVACLCVGRGRRVA